MSEKRSLADKLGWPDALRVAVVLLALAIVLAPYVGGIELGPLKVPHLQGGIADAAVIGGPVLLVVALALLLPIWSAPTPPPIRITVFQAQLPIIREVGELFIGKDEVTLRTAFGFRALFDVNVLSMAGEYALAFFNARFDRESGPFSWENCPQRMRPSTSDDDSLAVGSMGGTLPKAVAMTPEDRMARWSQYQHDPIYISRQWVDTQQRLTSLVQDPLLPKGLTELLTAYLDTAGRNLVVLFEILNAGAQELPTRCRSLQEVKSMSTDWLWDRYMKSFEHLKPDADRISGFMRTYFDPDNVTRA